MENKFIETWQEYSKNAVESAKELEAINAKIVEKITGKQMELANTVFEAGTKYCGAIGEVKGPQELIAEQLKFAAEFNEKLLTAARGTADMLVQTREAYQGWMEKAFKAASVGAEQLIPSFAAPKKAEKKAA